MKQRKRVSILRRFLHRLLVLPGAAAMTLLFFLVLPLIQTIHRPQTEDMTLRTVDVASLEPPPPIEEEKPQKEAEPEKEPPKLSEEAAPLDLSQIELVLNQGVSDNMMSGDFSINLGNVAAEASNTDALFSVGDLDQEPRVIYQPGPMLNREVRSKAPGKVYIIFIVDQRGRVENPIVQKSTDPVFEAPALAAVKQWKFEPGKRNGEPVRFRMRVPITFPKGR